MKTYKTFLNELNEDVDPEEAGKKFKEYEKKYYEEAKEVYFSEHLDEEWFRERYYEDEYKMKLDYFNDIHNKVFKEIIDNGCELPYLKFPQKLDENKTQDYTEPNILFLQYIPPSIKRDEFTNLFKDEEGFIECYFSDPSQFPPKNFYRFAWLVFDNEENANKVLKKNAGNHLKYSEDKDFIFNAMLNKSRPPSVLPPTANDRLEKDFTQINTLIDALDKSRSYENTFEGILNNDNIKSLTTREKMKIAVHYLKRCYLYSYYSGIQYFDYGQIIFVYIFI